MSCRESYTQRTLIPNGTAFSGTLSFYEFAYGIVHMPAAWTAADIGFYVASELNGTFQELFDSGGTRVEITGPAADLAMQVPTEVLAARYIQLWSQSAGVNVNQLAERELFMDMKS